MRLQTQYEQQTKDLNYLILQKKQVKDECVKQCLVLTEHKDDILEYINFLDARIEQKHSDVRHTEFLLNIADHLDDIYDKSFWEVTDTDRSCGND